MTSRRLTQTPQTFADLQREIEIAWDELLQEKINHMSTCPNVCVQHPRAVNILILFYYLIMLISEILIILYLAHFVIYLKLTHIIYLFNTNQYHLFINN